MADGEWLLDDWQEWMALQGLSPRTIDRRTWSIGQWLAHCGDLESVEPEDLDEMIIHRSTLRAMLDDTYWDQVALP